MRKKTHLLDQLRMSRENIRAIDALIQGRHGLDKWREIILDWADTKKTDACCRLRKSVEIWRHKMAAEFGVERETKLGPDGPRVFM